MGRWASLTMVLACSAMTLAAQQDGGDAEARSRELSERMRRTLEAQSRELSRMQRDLQRAARLDGGQRDSIVRVTSQQIAELAQQIARVQMEADRVQFEFMDSDSRAALRAQIASARAMANVTRALAGQQRQMLLSTTSSPRGYLGVTLESEQRMRVRDGKVFTEFVSPSVVLTVSPGSPAAKAGVEAGDTIVALGRATLPGEVLMSEVVKPGERLPVKLRRRGSERVVTVTVGEMPASSASPRIAIVDADGGNFTFCMGEDCGPGSTGPRLAVPRSVPARPPAAVSPATPPSAPSPPTAVAPYPPMRINGTAWAASDYSLAGAMMTTITDELEDLTGVDEGILVLRVAPGTPAASSGLRGGDVIIRVNGDDCEDVRDLQRAVQRASSRGGRSVALVVQRKKKGEQAITLQW